MFKDRTTGGTIGTSIPGRQRALSALPFPSGATASVELEASFENRGVLADFDWFFRSEFSRPRKA